MNWVGGARSRLKSRNERKLQQEFFERRRFLSKHKKHSSKDSQRAGKKSQDLIGLVNMNKIDSTHGKHQQGFVQKLDLDKFRTSERLEDVQIPLPLSPCSKPSTILLNNVQAEMEHERKRIILPERRMKSTHRISSGSNLGQMRRSLTPIPEDNRAIGMTNLTQKYQHINTTKGRTAQTSLPELEDLHATPLRNYFAGYDESPGLYCGEEENQIVPVDRLKFPNHGTTLHVSDNILHYEKNVKNASAKKLKTSHPGQFATHTNSVLNDHLSPKKDSSSGTASPCFKAEHRAEICVKRNLLQHYGACCDRQLYGRHSSLYRNGVHNMQGTCNSSMDRMNGNGPLPSNAKSLYFPTERNIEHLQNSNIPSEPCTPDQNPPCEDETAKSKPESKGPTPISYRQALEDTKVPERDEFYREEEPLTEIITQTCLDLDDEMSKIGDEAQGAEIIISSDDEAVVFRQNSFKARRLQNFVSTKSVATQSVTACCDACTSCDMEQHFVDASTQWDPHDFTDSGTPKTVSPKETLPQCLDDITMESLDLPTSTPEVSSTETADTESDGTPVQQGYSLRSRNKKE